MKDFHFDYCTFFIIKAFTFCCCCLTRCFKRRFSWWNSRIVSYKKWQIAQKRLMDEQDIQKIIFLNRVTRLIHKIRFKARQRRAVSYFRKYVLSDNDIDSSASERQDDKVADDFMEVPDAGILLKGFDPQSDLWDRRLLYEVTGMRLDDQDYRGDDTSSDEDGEGSLTESGRDTG